ncbi:MAG TPA: 50S ribosomal protein L25 [Anaerolineae bacterium]|nr:50S ribosomal protein L25 [Anaerolineae bacterium]
MSDFKLNAKRRVVIGKKVKALRRQGLLPGVLYGVGIEPLPIELDAKEASKILSFVRGSTLVTLTVDKDQHQVLLRDEQRDVIRRDLIHVDFLKVAMDVTIRTEVPVDFVGEAPAVSERGGVLVTELTEIEVEALPADLPDRIVVDLEPLAEIDDTITVGDLFFSKGVEVLTGPDEVLARVIYQMEEEIEEEEIEEIIPMEMEPELVERGKREEIEEGKKQEEDE